VSEIGKSGPTYKISRAERIQISFQNRATLSHYYTVPTYIMHLLYIIILARITPIACCSSIIPSNVSHHVNHLPAAAHTRGYQNIINCTLLLLLLLLLPCAGGWYNVQIRSDRRRTSASTAAAGPSSVCPRYTLRTLLSPVVCLR